MRVIYNRHFPFGSFWAINLLGLIFARSDRGRLGPVDLNHEHIHTLQQREMLFVVFYLWYLAEWIVRYVQYRDIIEAYTHISFEREAYSCQYDLDYQAHRRHYAWLRYLKG